MSDLREGSKPEVNERLQQIKERAEKATPEPWDWSHRKIPNDPESMYSTQVYDASGKTIADLAWYPSQKGGGWIGSSREENADFIANARQDIPWLLTQIEDIREELETAKDRARKWELDHNYVFNLYKPLLKSNAAILEENQRLKDWKESAIAVTPPLQEIGKEIGVALGDSIHDKILPAIINLKQRAEQAEAENQRLAKERDYLDGLQSDYAKKYANETAIRLSWQTRAEAAEAKLGKMRGEVVKVAGSIESWVQSRKHAQDERGEWHHWPKQLRAALAE